MKTYEEALREVIATRSSWSSVSSVYKSGACYTLSVVYGIPMSKVVDDWGRLE
jgi:hypothetical protein